MTIEEDHPALFQVESTAPQEFSFDDWLSSARLPERSTVIYGRGDLVATLEELEEELERAQVESKQQRKYDGRLTGSGREQQLIEQIRGVREEMKASMLTVRVRALSRDDIADIQKRAPKDDDGQPNENYLYAAAISIGAIHPKMTHEQCTMLQKKIGDGQYVAIFDLIMTATHAKRLDVPFSLVDSATLNQQDS